MQLLQSFSARYSFQTTKKAAQWEVVETDVTENTPPFRQQIRLQALGSPK